jgi:hypothetical protein
MIKQYEFLSDARNKAAEQLEAFARSKLAGGQVQSFEGEDEFSLWLDSHDYKGVLGGALDTDEVLPSVYRKMLGEEGMVPCIALHDSDSAYDACNTGQCHRGDVLVIESEGIVGIADTWPIAVTEQQGEFHSIEPGFHGSVLGSRGITNVTIDLAIERANELGYKLADWVGDMLANREGQQAAPASRGPGM